MKGLFRAAAGAALILASVAPFAAPAAVAQDDPRTSTATGYSIADDAVWSFYASNGGNLDVRRADLARVHPVRQAHAAVRKRRAPGTAGWRRSAVAAGGPVVPHGELCRRPHGASRGCGHGIRGAHAGRPELHGPTRRVSPGDRPRQLERHAGELLLDVQEWRWHRRRGVCPTSSPKADPNNPNFVYQRFQNGILFYDASSGTTAALPLGDYLKTQLTSDSPLLKVAAATQTDLSEAFQPDVELSRRSMTSEKVLHDSVPGHRALPVGAVAGSGRMRSSQPGI